LSLLAAAAPSAASEPSPAQLAARQASLQSILTTVSSKAVTTQRMTCMLGEEPGRVSKGRLAGEDFIPDAADTCVAVLVRTARDGRLPDLYRTLLAELGGSTGMYQTLPLAIGNAVLDGSGKVAIGNGKVTDVPPPLAFDAGFTVAYLKGDAREQNMDPAKLKLVTEACLDVREDAGTCFSVGYAQAGRALSADR